MILTTTKSGRIEFSLFIILLEELVITGVSDPNIELQLAIINFNSGKIIKALEAGANLHKGIGEIFDKYHPQINKILSFSPRIKLFLTLQRLSLQTWERLEWSKSLNLSQGEETITDINLLEIKSEFIDGVDVWKCPKDLESQTGVDWLWLIGSNIRGWRMFAVQAKKVDVKTDKYKKLDYEVVSIDRKQIDILKDFALSIGAVPVYCLYNYVNNAADSHWHCKYRCDFKQLGCSITNISVIEQAIELRGKKNFDYIHSNSCTVPWKCLLECRHRSFPSKTKPYEYIDNCFGKTIIYSKIPLKVERLLRAKSTSEILDAIGNDLVPKKIMIFNLDPVVTNENLIDSIFQEI